MFTNPPEAAVVDEETALALVRDRDTSETVLGVLAEHPSEKVVQELAALPNLPTSVLTALLATRREAIGIVLAGREDLADSYLCVLTGRFNYPSVERVILGRDHLPEDVFRIIATHGNLDACVRMASRADLPPSVLFTLSNNPNPGVARALLARADLPLNRLQAMAASSQPAIARAAQEKLTATASGHVARVPKKGAKGREHQAF